MIAAAVAALLILLPVSPAQAAEVSASCAILMDGDTGTVLYEKNAHEPRLIASITKLMTALVVLESGHDLKEEIAVPADWTGVEGSSIYLRPGEQVTLETLLYGMLLQSGNDAATLAALECAGSVEAFAENMNAKAAELGMKDSHFTNPTGLNEEGHYSTAYDMALLARACLQNETLAEVASTRSVALAGRVFTNHNKLLWRYEGCVGLKTGYTEKAGRTLVSAAERDGMTLICVTLNDPNDWADHTALFDQGFAGYESRLLAEAGETLCRLPVSGGLTSFCGAAAGEDARLCVARGEEVERELVLDQTALTAPVAQGTQLGEAVYRVNGEEKLRIPLVAGTDVDCCLRIPSGWEQLWEKLTGLLPG